MRPQRILRLPYYLCLGCLLLLARVMPLAAQPYIPPANPRVDLNLNPGWRFIRQDISGAQAVGFDDASWSGVNLPHTWNNLDGEDGGNNYYRGIGWYRSHYTVDAGYAGRRFFLKFDGAFCVTDVWLNGQYLGEHPGGFAAFVFDVTPYLNVGADNVIAVKVSNASNTNLPPLSADFTFFGGLYRDAHLLVTGPVQISPLDYASPGVYLKTTKVSAASANLQVTTVVSNAGPAAATVTVRAVVTDGATNIVTTLTNVVTLAPATVSNVVAGATIANPHLWDGLADPYLYQVFVEVWNGPTAVDLVAQPLGLRWFSVNPTNGFSLNGHYLDLHGVSMHQDWFDRGWAIGDAERLTNFAFLKEIGATALRLSHYEHAEHTYQLADQNGIVLWSEIPLINNITEAPAFYTNAQQQLRELIRQRYNHPSVVCWGLFNEITLHAGPRPTNLVSQLARLAAQEDPTRPSVSAANASDNEPSNWYSDLTAFNKYFGWYDGSLSGFGSWADKIHANYPTRPIGISEYGAGANVSQHSEDPVTEPAAGGKFHPEEYQNLYHESHWQQMQARPFLWCKLIWNLFDFASDARNEGNAPGRNDKGLVTYDRQVRKDAFYWYKANWTTNPMVYITGHTFTNRLTTSVTAKVYANCDSVEVFLNGTSQGARSSTNRIFTWPMTLLRGTNALLAVGTKGSTRVRDSLIWNAPSGEPKPSHGPAKVEVRQAAGRYFLCVDGKPFYVKGAGLGSGSQEKLAEHGGNSFRTWRTENGRQGGQPLLDRARKNGLYVAMGLDLGRERQGFDYNDKAAVARQFERVKTQVLNYKDHPALLLWLIGNELNLNARNPNVWNAVNDLSKMIHQLDPNHPTTTALAGLSKDCVRELKARAPDLDLLSIQMYADLMDLPRHLREAGWEGPYLVTEWGATGHWEVTKTDWGAPIENDSTTKAEFYRKRFEAAIRSDQTQCLGSYVFLWGHKQERTPTWYGMFLDSGEETATVDVLHYLWNGAWPANRSPRIQGTWLDRKTAHQNVHLKPGHAYTASVLASDPDRDPLTYLWEVMPESTDLKEGGDFESIPACLPALIQDPKQSEIVLKAPGKTGAYRLFAYVFDGQGHAAHANIPFYVDGAAGSVSKVASH